MPKRKGISLCATTALTDVDATTTEVAAAATTAAAAATTTAAILISDVDADAVPLHLHRLPESISAS